MQFEVSLENHHVGINESGIISTKSNSIDNLKRRVRNWVRSVEGFEDSHFWYWEIETLGLSCEAVKHPYGKDGVVSCTSPHFAEVTVRLISLYK